MKSEGLNNPSQVADRFGSASLLFENRIRIHTEDLSSVEPVETTELPCLGLIEGSSGPIVDIQKRLWLSYKEHTVDDLAQEGDEGRDKLR